MNEMTVINLHITLTKQTHWLESFTKVTSTIHNQNNNLPYKLHYTETAKDRRENV